MKNTTNPGCFITYAGLKFLLDQLTPEQLAQNVTVYAGDVDDSMAVFGTCFNTDEEMGTALDTEPVGAFLLII